MIIAKERKTYERTAAWCPKEGSDHEFLSRDPSFFSLSLSRARGREKEDEEEERVNRQ